MQEPERRTYSHRGGEQSYLYWDGPSSDAPVLHFAHANGFNAYTYRRMLGPLADHFTVFAIDMRGHGQSTLPANPETHKSWAVYGQDLNSFLDGVVPGRQVILAGHSMGGTSSLLAAGAQPDRVRGLALIDPVILPRPVYWMMHWRRLARLGGRRFPLVRAAQARRAVWPNGQAMVTAYTGRGAFKTWPVEVIEDYVTGGTRPHAEGVELACAPAWEAANFAWHAHNPWRAMDRVACPSILLRGTVGSTCPGIIARQVRGKIKGMKDRAVDGATHFVPMEFPALIRGELLALADHVTG